MEKRGDLYQKLHQGLKILLDKLIDAQRIEVFRQNLYFLLHFVFVNQLYSLLHELFFLYLTVPEDFDAKNELKVGEVEKQCLN